MKNNLSTDPYKGVRDFYPEDMAVQKHIFDVWRKTCESFGYEEYNASILEPTELYLSKSNEEIVSDQTYSFTDRGNRNITLRPEMTPTVARMIASKRKSLNFPLRWFSIANVFRYERPQKGRLREHWQLNADMFGSSNLQADTEIIILMHSLMKNFGAKDSDFEIHINSRKLINSVLGNFYSLDESQIASFRKLLDRKNKIDTFEEEAEKILGKPFIFLGGQEDSAELKEALTDPMISEAWAEIQSLKQALSDAGIKNVKYSDSIVRGFDYYTGIVFEVFDTKDENRRSLFGGGRYDNILDIFGAERTPAVGFGMGDVTLRDFLESHDLLPTQKSTASLYVGLLDKNDYYFVSDKLQGLRDVGINIEIDISDKKIGDQIKIADKKGVPFFTAFGDEEKKTGEIRVKNLKTGKESSLKLSAPEEILATLKESRTNTL